MQGGVSSIKLHMHILRCLYCVSAIHWKLHLFENQMTQMLYTVFLSAGLKKKKKKITLTFLWVE